MGLTQILQNSQITLPNPHLNSLSKITTTNKKIDSNSIPTMSEVMEASKAQKIHLQLQTLGPFFRITAKSLETQNELGRAEGLIRVWFGGRVLHLDSIRLRRETLGMERSIFGIGLFIGAVAIRYGYECGCGSAELLAINDSELYHSKGIGEPLNNYTALVEAIRVMTGSPFWLSLKRITVSTVGIIHAIKKLQNDIPNLNLAVSLPAPVQDIRCQIMPAARAFPLESVMDTLREYQKNSQQKIFIEYIMLDGVNDEEQHAHQLGKLLETFEVVVNLIPFNPIGTLSHFSTSSEQKVTKFQKILRGTYNIRTTIRKQMGQDMSGACDQLVVNQSDKRSTGSAGLLTDIEDLSL